MSRNLPVDRTGRPCLLNGRLERSSDDKMSLSLRGETLIFW